jgi:hypothetical protein
MYANAQIIRIAATTDKCTCGTGMGPVIIAQDTVLAAN